MPFSLKGLFRGIGTVAKGFAGGGILGGIGAGVGLLTAKDKRNPSSGTQFSAADKRSGIQKPINFQPPIGSPITPGTGILAPPVFVPGGGGFGGAGAGGSFGPAAPPIPPRGPAGGGMVQRGLDVSGIAVAQAPQQKVVAMRRPGFVTVTLPWPAFGFQAGMKVQMMKEIARKLGLWKPRPKPFLTRADIATVRRADRIEKKLTNATKQFTDMAVMSRSSVAQLRRNQRPKSQRK